MTTRKHRPHIDADASGTRGVYLVCSCSRESLPIGRVTEITAALLDTIAEEHPNAYGVSVSTTAMVAVAHARLRERESAAPSDHRPRSKGTANPLDHPARWAREMAGN